MPTPEKCSLSVKHQIHEELAQKDATDASLQEIGRTVATEVEKYFETKVMGSLPHKTALYDTEQTAKILGVAYQTIANWRNQRRNLNYVMVGRKPMYEASEIERFIESNRIFVRQA